MYAAALPSPGQSQGFTVAKATFTEKSPLYPPPTPTPMRELSLPGITCGYHKAQTLENQDNLFFVVVNFLRGYNFKVKYSINRNSIYLLPRFTYHLRFAPFLLLCYFLCFFLTMGWPKISFGLTCNVLRKNPNKLYGQPNI